MAQSALVHSGRHAAKPPLFESAMDLFSPHLPCDEKQLRRVYLRLALQYHPDKQSETDRKQAKELFQAIAAAYESLLTPTDGGQKKEVRRVRTAVAAAAELGDLEELQRMLNLLPENAANEPDDNGQTPLMFAAAGGSIEAAQLLIDFGADIHAKNFLKWSVIVFASLADQEEMVRWLVGQGLKMTDRDLILTAWTGNVKSLGVLLELYQGNLHQLLTYMNTRKTLLHMACEGMFLLKRSPEQHADCVRLLIAYGIPINLSDPGTGRACLHDYVSEDRWLSRWENSSVHMQILEELCLASADVSNEDIDGKSAISIATENGCDKVRAILYTYL